MCVCVCVGGGGGGGVMREGGAYMWDTTVCICVPSIFAMSNVLNA